MKSNPVSGTRADHPSAAHRLCCRVLAAHGDFIEQRGFTESKFRPRRELAQRGISWDRFSRPVRSMGELAMYLIRGLEPRTDITMGAHGFCIELSPQWKAMVASCGLTQEKVDGKIRTCGNDWLDSCGYSSKSSYDKTQRLYESRHAIRIQWGEWGPEHISVPGNACGLDIERCAFGAFMHDAAMLTPHNIDCWPQKQLLLIVFCSFAEDVVLFSRDSVSSVNYESHRSVRPVHSHQS